MSCIFNMITILINLFSFKKKKLKKEYKHTMVSKRSVYFITTTALHVSSYLRLVFHFLRLKMMVLHSLQSTEKSCSQDDTKEEDWRVEQVYQTMSQRLSVIFYQTMSQRLSVILYQTMYSIAGILKQKLTT
jgi:hypothetical protein